MDDVVKQVHAYSNFRSIDHTELSVFPNYRQHINIEQMLREVLRFVYIEHDGDTSRYMLSATWRNTILLC